MNTTREDKTRRTNATTEKTEKATLSWQRERFAKVSVFLCARGKSVGFCSICVCFSRSVTSVCG